MLTDEHRYASECGDETERPCEMNGAHAIDSGERRAYGEQPKRKPENW